YVFVAGGWSDARGLGWQPDPPRGHYEECKASSSSIRANPSQDGDAKPWAPTLWARAVGRQATEGRAGFRGPLRTRTLPSRPVRVFISHRPLAGEAGEVGAAAASNGGSDPERGNFMRQCFQPLLRFLQAEDGPTAVEYAVMLALIVVVCL